MENLVSTQNRSWSPRELLEVLERMETALLSPGEQEALLAGHAALANVKRPDARAVDCPHCGDHQSIPAHDASWHIARCERHPLRLRFEQLVRVANRLLAGTERARHVEGLSTLTFPTSGPAFPSFRPFAQAVAYLGDPAASEDQRLDARWMLRHELRWRLHAVDPSTDPCPWCLTVFPCETFIAHLWTCPRHPAAGRAAVLHDAVLERCGEAALHEAIAQDRLRHTRSVLSELVAACQRYAGGMGYHGHGQYYSKKWIEQPWLRALRLAEHHASDARAHGEEEPVLSALSLLVKQCWRFWNGMGDDTGGRSIIEEADCRAWQAQVETAARVLS